MVLLAHFPEVIGNFAQQFQVQPGVVVGAFQGSHLGFGGRMAGAVGKGRNGGINPVGTGFDGFQLAHGRQACGGMAVNHQWQVDGGFDGFHQLKGGIGGEQAGHILDGDGICTHGFKFQGLLNKQLRSMHRAGGVANGALGMLAGFFHRFHGGFQVAQIVQGVEHPEHINTVVGGFLHKGFHHVIGVMPVTQQVLAPQQHLQAGVGQGLA